MTWLESYLFKYKKKNHNLPGSSHEKETKEDEENTIQMSNFSVGQPTDMTKNVELTKQVSLFQSVEEEEFPSTDNKEPRIPHIIHQMYADEMIPQRYVNLVKSFIRLNPTWEYRFWTDQTGRQLLQKHHPYLVNVYDKFGNNVKRSDMLRYAVLYEYGGFYADFDMENLRSLNNTTFKYACIFPVEPFEHSAFLYKKPYIINNAFMGCRPKHPFLKLLLSVLRGANVHSEPVGTTGPVFVTKMFIRYNEIRNESLDKNKTDWSSNSPYFYKGQLQEIDNNAVYVPNSQYFMDKIDPIHLHRDGNGKFPTLCKNVQILSHLQQRGCFELSSRKIIRANRKYTYTLHHWYHLWCNKKEVIEKLEKVNISSVVHNCIQYHDA